MIRVIRALAAALALAVISTIAAPTFAQTQDARAVVADFQSGLLGVMKDARALGVKGRFDRLMPVVDKTGLTNSYDFSTVFDGQTQERLSLKATRRATIEKMLNGWGLALKPDTAFIEMLVVKRDD